MNKILAVIIVVLAILAFAIPAFAKGSHPKATGQIWMSNPNQQIIFNAHDYGPDSSLDKGYVEYWNYEYPGGVLQYKTKVICATVKDDEAYFMFQIPSGWPGLSGKYVVSWVHDGGTPGTAGDEYGHKATNDSSQAESWCENGVGVTNYPVTGGNLKVHTY